MRNIALVGFMGCGKTTVGKLLAEKLGIKFLDTDLQIQCDMNMSVKEIFDKYGESCFRQREKDLCKKISLTESLVIATGGGIIKNKSNLDALRISSDIFYLKAHSQKIYNNLKNDYSRPLLNGAADKYQKIVSLMAEREPMYQAAADYILDVTSYQPEESVNMLADIVFHRLA